MVLRFLKNPTEKGEAALKEIDPNATSRAEAFALWMRAPMPMVTIHKTLDVTPLVKAGRRGWKFNMLLCWHIGLAAAQTEEFFLLPVGDRLMAFDRLAISTVAALENGGISTCDVPYSPDLQKFNEEYLRLTRQVRQSGRAHDLGESHMVIGTSALPQTEIDGAVNIYAGCYNNPFLIWGKYRKKLLKCTLPVSFQFHHTQMDGGHAAAFLERLQKGILSPLP